MDENSEVYRDEIFGPVLTVRSFTDDDDALRQANDTEYGLAASAWTRDVYRAQRASREINAGCVWINDHIPIISEMPHGGVGASGFGKDMSDYSLEEYLTIKHVMSDITGVADKELAPNHLHEALGRIARLRGDREFGQNRVSARSLGAAIRLDRAPNGYRGAMSATPGLKKALNQRQLRMIAIGGVIGAGLFVGSGVVIGDTGPGASSPTRCPAS